MINEQNSMKNKGILNSFLGLFQTKDNINIRNLRLQNLPYMLIFPLAPVFANMQGSLFSESTQLLGLDAMTLMGSAYCVGAGVLFGLTSVKNMAKAAHFLAIGTALTFFTWLFLAESQINLVVAIAFMFGLGGCAACASFAYTYALNNTERLLGAAAISLFFALNQLDSGLSFIAGFFDKTYLTMLVAGTCICLLFYKTDDFSLADANSEAKMNPALKLMLYFFIAHYFVEIFYTYLPGASSPGAMAANGAVGIFVVCLAVALQLITKNSIWSMCNLFFVAIIATYALHFFPETSGWRVVARLIHGFEQMGYIAAYYLLGCVFKKHGNFRIFKRCLTTILPVSMLTYVIPGIITARAPAILPLTATLTSATVFALFIFMSPAYSKHLFSADWSKDLYSVDMAERERRQGQLDLLENFNLSPREREVANYLLVGLTTKDIAIALDISVNTVNFHIKNLYKKLGISARGELFALLYSAPDVKNNEQYGY